LYLTNCELQVIAPFLSFFPFNIRIIVPAYVDDLTIVSNSQAAVDKLKADLKSHFKLRELGPTEFLLGVKIVRDRAKRTLKLSQRQYIVDMLARYGFSDCHPSYTPINPGCVLSTNLSPKTPQDVQAMRSVPYAQAVGSLQYLATATRPDISYTVGLLARFNSNPGIEHWKAVKHLFRYLKATMDYELVFSPPSSPSSEIFTAYADADHGGCKDSGKSTGAYVMKMGTGVVSWSSKLQSIVTLSTTEAEYISAVSAGQEIMWLRTLFTEMGYPSTTSSSLHLDNQSAIKVAKNPEHHGRMKHLDLRHFWLRDTVKSGTISVHYTPTAFMPADILTKPLDRVKTLRCCEMLGLRPSGGSQAP
jgi:hypothetical protein